MKQMYARVGIALLYLLAFAWPSLMGMPLWASNISLANFFGTVQVVNNGTAETYQSSNITNIKVSNFVDGGYVASASNTTMAMRTTSGADVAFMPGYSNSTWMTWVSGIGEDAALNYLFYTGNITGGKVRYFPTAAGMTTLDSGTLELAANFTIEQAGYIDTSAGADKNLVYKQIAFCSNITNDGEITASIPVVLSGTIDILPDSAGDYTNITFQQPAVLFHWDKVDDPVGVPDDAATTVNDLNAAELKDAYNLAAPSWTGTIVTVDSVTVYYRIWNSTAVAGQTGTPYLRLGGVETNGTPKIMPAAWTTYSELLARPGGGSWTEADIATLQVAFGLDSNGAVNIQLTQIYVQVAYTYIAAVPTYISITATGVASGEHTVEVGLELR